MDVRIAIIAEVYFPKVDGVVYRTLNLLQELVRCKDEVLMFCPEGEGCLNSPVPVVPVPSFAFPVYPEYRVGVPSPVLAERLEMFKPDIVHFINPFAFGFRCYDVLQKCGPRVPTLFSFHTLYGEFVKRYKLLWPLSKVLWWMTRQYHNRADMNMTVSTAMLEDLERRGFQRMRLWPPAVDSELFHPGRKNPAMRNRLSHGDPEKPLLVTVSRLAPEKNVEFLASILDELPDARLAVVGDGPHRGELERRFAGRPARFLGYLKGVELAEAYASADAFVYASETETMGNVILEALACGCPVIAPRAGGIPSLVVEGETGLLYAPGKLDDAVQATRSVLENVSLRNGLTASARQRIGSWNWENAVERVRQVYQETIRDFHASETKLTVGQRMASFVATSLVWAFRSMAKDRNKLRQSVASECDETEVMQVAG
jgi:glycosyltransferase involved in cell wall biosynthesis